MIRDASYLDREWVPEDLQHRNAEKNAPRSALSPLVDDSSWSALGQVLIKGPSGAGKTALSPYSGLHSAGTLKRPYATSIVVAQISHIVSDWCIPFLSTYRPTTGPTG